MKSLFLTYKEHYKALIYLGVPIVIGQIGVILVGFADTLMVGRHSTLELGAASFVNNVFALVIVFSTGFAYGLTPIVGSLYGKNELHSIGRMLKNSLWANFLLSLLLIGIMTVLYFNIERLGQPEELIPYIKPYYLIILSSLVFILLFNGFRQFVEGITDTKVSMWILLGGNLFNILGNYLLIYGKLGLPELGLIGAGISTLVSRMLMATAFAVMFFYNKRYRFYRTGFNRSNINRKDLNQLNKLGWPIAFQMGMETASFSLTAIMIGWIGTIALAAHQIMLSISQVCFMMYYGMGAAIAVRVSNFKGKEDNLNIRRSTYAGFHIILVMAIIACIPIYFLRNQLGAWFNDDPEVIHLVAGLIIPLLLYQFGDGLQIAFANALRGISDVKALMVMAFISYFIISLPLAYFCGFILEWGTFGVWMGFPFGLTSAGIMFYLRFRKKTKLKS